MRHRALAPLLAAAAAAMLCCSCGTIMQPGPDMIPVSSEPQGARIYLDDEPNPVGVTPATIAISRSAGGGGEVKVRLELAGYHPQEVVVGHVFNGWWLGNILFWPGGFIVGTIVDWCTCSSTKWPERPMHVALTPLDRPPPLALEFPGPGTSEPVAAVAKAKTPPTHEEIW